MNKLITKEEKEEFYKVYFDLVKKVKKAKYIKEIGVLIDEWIDNTIEIRKLMKANEEIRSRILEIVKFANGGDKQ